MSVQYEPVIGLEVHVQLSTQSKLFCSCPVTFGAEPNSKICPICTGLPGVLPVLNARAVEYAVKTSLALGCRVRPTSVFARKNYFYPDLPKGYQISQYEAPLARNGVLEFRLEGNSSRVGIARVHLEEEAGKLVHDMEGSVSCVDYNRAGIPLLEIVSEPVIRSPREAYFYLRRLRQVIRYIGVSDARMEEGNFRCDANLSVRPKGARGLGVKTEIKNLNSFKSVEAALLFEIERQTELLRAGRGVDHDTLLWNEGRGRTLVMRTKEGADDYRYFPEPDLPPLVVEHPWLEEIRGRAVELPWEKEERFRNEYRLPEYDIGVLTSDPDIADYFEAVLEAHDDPKSVSNWVMGEVLARLKLEGIGVKDLKIGPGALAEILSLIEEGVISGKLAKSVFREVAETGVPPRRLVEMKGTTQITDERKIGRAVEKVIAENPEVVSKYRKGKEGVIGYLVGQVMEMTAGRANPKQVHGELRKRLEK